MYLGRCILPDAVGDDDYSGSASAAPSGSLIINGPPDHGCCNICNRHISELEPFGGPGDPCVGDFSGMKLLKKFREELPDYIGASWECRDCIGRPGGLWEIAEEDRLGRELTDDECRTMRADIEKQLYEMHSETDSE